MVLQRIRAVKPDAGSQMLAPHFQVKELQTVGKDVFRHLVSCRKGTCYALNLFNTRAG